MRISSAFRLTCKSDTTNLTQDKTHSQNDSEFKVPRVTTDIMDKYPNLTDNPFFSRRDSIHNISEYTLNIFAYSKSDITSYCTGADPFKVTVDVGNSAVTPPAPPGTPLGMKKLALVSTTH